MCRTSFPSDLELLFSFFEVIEGGPDDPVVGAALLGYGSQLEAGPKPGGRGLVSTQGQQSQESRGSHPGELVPMGFWGPSRI